MVKDVEREPVGEELVVLVGLPECVSVGVAVELLVWEKEDVGESV